MPLVVHYWAYLQSVHWLHCYGNITQTPNVSEYMIVLALCLVTIVVMGFNFTAGHMPVFRLLRRIFEVSGPVRALGP